MTVNHFCWRIYKTLLLLFFTKLQHEFLYPISDPLPSSPLSLRSYWSQSLPRGWSGKEICKLLNKFFIFYKFITGLVTRTSVWNLFVGFTNPLLPLCPMLLRQLNRSLSHMFRDCKYWGLELGYYNTGQFTRSFWLPTI